jgi:aldose 1-epimerase
MSDLISLIHGDFVLDIAPLAGGGIARLDWRGLEILRPALTGAIEARDPLGLSCFPMTPYVSRITDGVFKWGEVTTAIAPNMAGGSHPLHGIGWRKPWQVIDQSDSQISLGLDHAGDADWPWAFSTQQDFVLHDDHLAHSLSVTNKDARTFPSSLGPHPYFHADNAIISFDAEALWEISGESLPTHKARPAVVDALAKGTRADGLDLDHCFEGWNGVAHIAWPSHQVRIEASCALGTAPIPCTRLQLYTPKGQAFFCLEPVSARCVAFGEADPAVHGVVALAQETLSITTRFYPSKTA